MIRYTTLGATQVTTLVCNFLLQRLLPSNNIQIGSIVERLTAQQ